MKVDMLELARNAGECGRKDRAVQMKAIKHPSVMAVMEKKTLTFCSASTSLCDSALDSSSTKALRSVIPIGRMPPQQACTRGLVINAPSNEANGFTTLLYKELGLDVKQALLAGGSLELRLWMIALDSRR